MSKNFWELFKNHVFLKNDKISKKKYTFKRGKVKLLVREVKKFWGAAMFLKKLI